MPNESLKRLQQSGALDGTGALPDQGTDPTGYFDSLFQRGPSPMGNHGVRQVPLDLIDPWSDSEHERQPFRPYTEEKLQELADNILQNGVITPIRLRPSPTTSGRYQLLAGHNRVKASKLAGLQTIPAVIQNVDNTTAKLILIDSNLYQRQHLYPSEKAFSYKMRLEALKRKAGRPPKNNSAQLEPNLVGTRSNEQLAQKSKDSRATIQRYIRLTYLLPQLLDMVDAEAIPFTAGVSISFLPEQAQNLLLTVIQQYDIHKVTRSQGEELKSFRNELTEEMILRIFDKSKKSLPKPQNIKFAVEYPPKITKKLKHDAELQRRVLAVIDEYVKEISHAG